MTPKQRAEQSAAALWAADHVSQNLGFEIINVEEGQAALRMVVREAHCNGHGICHGGITFTLADSAFAFACNSRNQATVAQHNSITYLAAAQMGDVLTAVAQEVCLSGRSGIYDVRVSNQENVAIAVFRGASRQIKDTVFKE
ncbi:hydroxyphenylacetyl-CoA thioesterase PaaI [Shimia sp. R11_0]|uniref:hydroxyphenylacetyl-CoA thioesterase PaaI n=1 Tax=Shimia sp. R11_0 TaxID=2821096 RepID=UPI001ADADD25|nr:hydroxyphenylacetyl-CoA thioesterase PaaI [Shimia sp. R11_0]MBO9477052.1 hydroxyphenylacetyl-CoA thioesterase PaaI [Shimia sp. R11_0]